jgi:hypothetical protein
MVAGATTAAIAGGRARRLAWRRRYRARGRGPGARGGPPAHPGALGGDGEAREGRTATPRSTEAVAGRGEDGGVGDERESPASIPSTRMLREARRSFGRGQLGAGVAVEAAQGDGRAGLGFRLLTERERERMMRRGRG